MLSSLGDFAEYCDCLHELNRLKSITYSQKIDKEIIKKVKKCRGDTSMYVKLIKEEIDRIKVDNN